MLDLLRARLKQGTRTSPFPLGRDELPERFRGLPVIDPAGSRGPSLPPSQMIASGPDGEAVLDVGACLFSPEEAASTPAGAIRFSRDPRLASSTRGGLVSATGEIELAKALTERMRRLFGRSLRLRSVAAGSCGGCEAELVALGNVVFDMARFGVQFVASPRHADGLVITGTVNRNMRIALERTWEATPPPRIVIAVGACTLAGGPFRASAEAGTGVGASVPVDLWIPGCPPHPLTILDGLLRLLGQVPEAGEEPVMEAGSDTAAEGSAEAATR